MLLNHTVLQAGWSGGDGLITVSGAGSRLVTSSESILVVGTGDNGNTGSPLYNTGQTTHGALTVTDGGSVQVGKVAVGLYGNGVGTVTVDGPNSLLHVVQEYHVNGGTGVEGGSGTTQISNGGSLVVDGQIFFGGDAKDGTGSLIVQSGGTLELGDKVENGQTTSALLDEEGVGGQSNLILSGGAIKLINSGLSTAMDMQLTGGVQSTLDTNGRTAVLSGVLAGNGGLAKAGQGTLVLSGTNTYAGATEVQSGTLEVDGGVASAVSVRNGATLAGVGNVGTTTVDSGATLSPGTASHGGSLTITGDLAMAHGSTLLLNNVSTTQPALLVAGAATLSGGTVQLSGVQSLHYGEQYTLVSAAQGVSGQYDGVDAGQANIHPFLTPTLLYTADTVNLQLLRNAVPFAAVARTRNQQAAGAGLQGVALNSSVVRAVVQLGGTRAVDAALDALSGEIHASIRTVLVQDAQYMRQAVSDRLAGAWCDNGWAQGGLRTALVHQGHILQSDGCTAAQTVMWSEAYGGFGNNSGDGNVDSLHHSTSGFIMGADTALGESGRWRAGGLVSYGRSMVDGGGRSSSGQSNNISLGGYVGAHWGGWTLHVGAGYTWNLLALSRKVAFAGFGNTLSSQYNGGTAQGFGELGYRLHLGRSVLEPFGNMAYLNQHTGSFRERGGVAALRGRASDAGVTFATFGLRASASFLTYGAWVTPHAMLGYRHTFGPVTATMHETFAAGSGGYGMDVAGVSLSRDTAVLDAGVRVKLTDRIDIDVSYMGQYGGPSTSSGAHGRVTFRF
ncbi:autotransporter domain-containing protein [Acetobacter sp. LMG 32666]|uniref:autotransporter outer membrane beta-barrel domain-containing protein n=1 Tax=Acetobacter sp. LMG 32666 TaxID=2959295 RepID=UPI0030C88C22